MAQHVLRRKESTLIITETGCGAGLTTPQPRAPPCPEALPSCARGGAVASSSRWSNRLYGNGGD
eukprot:364170-Chlamydomonas_euryale.AAC.5